MTTPTKPGHFGPAVIGQEQFEAEQKILQKGAHIFGPLVTGDGTFGPAVEAPKQATMPEGVKAAAPASIADVEELLAKNPATFDILFEAELAREDGPRKGALRAFKRAEEEQGPSARADVIAKIDELLKE